MMTVEQALASEKFAYARARQWCRQWIVYIYHQEPASPTGVLLAATCEDSKDIDALFRKHGCTSPLGPDEREGR